MKTILTWKYLDKIQNKCRDLSLSGFARKSFVRSLSIVETVLMNQKKIQDEIIPFFQL